MIMIVTTAIMIAIGTQTRTDREPRSHSRKLSLQVIDQPAPSVPADSLMVVAAAAACLMAPSGYLTKLRQEASPPQKICSA
jgi:hypothetical protein